MRRAEIIGWGKGMPPTVLSNADLEKIVETTDEWITTRTGMKERRISHVESSELAVVAAKHALACAGLEAGEIDLIIVATCTPETLIPPTSALVQAKLGATSAGAMDLNANCSGFLYGLVNASAMISSEAVDTVLLIGVEKLSFVVDYTDRKTCVLFGDGAGAVVLRGSDGPAGLLTSELGVDGDSARILCVPQFGTVGTPGDRDPRLSGICMEGQDVFRKAVTRMGDASANVVERAGWSLKDVDILIPHQANKRIIDATARRLKLDDTQVFVNVHKYGNTSSATIPVALTEALEQGLIKPGAKVVLAAFGGGLTWAAATMQWGERVTPIGTSDAAVPPSDKTVFELMQPNFDFFGLPEKLA